MLYHIVFIAFHENAEILSFTDFIQIPCTSFFVAPYEIWNIAFFSDNNIIFF